VRRVTAPEPPPPAGGIVVAEIQTPSDTTFRVYDWGRSGPGRELHIEDIIKSAHAQHGRA
jgi:mannose-6-phosphate isomerase